MVTLRRVAEEGSIGLLIRIIARTPLACAVYIGLIEKDFRISSLGDVCWLIPCLVEQTMFRPKPAVMALYVCTMSNEGVVLVWKGRR